jgi:hypothetical protein
MNLTHLTIIAIVVVFVVTIIVAFILLITVRKVNKLNTVKNEKLSEINWDELSCPKCKTPLDKGFSRAGRGIIWRDKKDKRPNQFSTIGSVLENSISLTMLPALNISWRCSACKLVVIDNSKMVKIKKCIGASCRSLRSIYPLS